LLEWNINPRIRIVAIWKDLEDMACPDFQPYGNFLLIWNNSSSPSSMQLFLHNLEK
jgi:hypothetical protein